MSRCCTLISLARPNLRTASFLSLNNASRGSSVRPWVSSLTAAPRSRALNEGKLRQSEFVDASLRSSSDSEVSPETGAARPRLEDVQIHRAAAERLGAPRCRRRGVLVGSRPAARGSNPDAALIGSRGSRRRFAIPARLGGWCAAKPAEEFK